MNHILLWMILLVIVWALIEQKLIVTSKYKIKSGRVSESFNHTSFVILADLHNRNFGRNNRRLIRRIDDLKPDYILVAGDMVNKKSPSYPSNAYYLLEQLAKRYKIYYAYGNHEQKLELYRQASEVNELENKNRQKIIERNENTDKESKEKVTVAKTQPNLELSKEQFQLSSTWVEFKDRLSHNNVTFLDNEHITLQKKESKVTITGISIAPKYFERHKKPSMEERYLKKLIGNPGKDNFQILIAHNPVYFKEYADWGADLIVSGHLHGGMVRLPGIGGVISPQAKFFPKYQSGVHEVNGRNLVVSRGLGSHSIMPRLFNIPELVYIELEKGSK